MVKAKPVRAPTRYQRCAYTRRLRPFRLFSADYLRHGGHCADKRLLFRMKMTGTADHVMSLAGFLGKDRFAGRRLVATGFSRGGLGVLQLVSAFPSSSGVGLGRCRPATRAGMTRRRPRFQQPGNRRWRLGQIRCLRNAKTRHGENSVPIWPRKIPHENYAVTELSHPEMALAAYGGSALSDSRNNLYEFLNLEFRKQNEPASGEAMKTESEEVPLSNLAARKLEQEELLLAQRVRHGDGHSAN